MRTELQPCTPGCRQALDIQRTHVSVCSIPRGHHHQQQQRQQQRQPLPPLPAASLERWLQPPQSRWPAISCRRAANGRETIKQSKQEDRTKSSRHSCLAVNKALGRRLVPGGHRAWRALMVPTVRSQRLHSFPTSCDCGQGLTPCDHHTQATPPS